MFKRILVATDGSVLAEEAVSKAIDLTAEHKAEFRAVTVVRRQAESYMDGTIEFEAEEIDRIGCRRTEQAKTLLEALEKRAAACGVRISTASVRSNRVADSIIGAAVNHGSDLIVMASHGRKGLTRAFLAAKPRRC